MALGEWTSCGLVDLERMTTTTMPATATAAPRKGEEEEGEEVAQNVHQYCIRATYTLSLTQPQSNDNSDRHPEPPVNTFWLT